MNLSQRTISHCVAFSSTSPLFSSSARAMSTASFFKDVQLCPPDEIFNTGIRYRADTSPLKVDLGVGAYRTNEGKPLVLNVVKKAETMIHEDKTLNKEYLDIAGDAKFVEVARQLLFGADSPAIKENRVASAQGISGTGSLRIGLDFLAKFLPKGPTLYISAPTWGNHLSMFAAAGLPYKSYRYWNATNRTLDIEGMVADLEGAPQGSYILLHSCAHNPTGVDPTEAQWKQIASVIRSKGHLPFFDSAYQGFASGDLDRDAWAVRYFIKEGFELLAAQSFAKNFGLYNERAGLISIVCATEERAKAVLSQMKMVIRPNYSNPPAHGARIVAAVLSDPALYEEWKGELKGMSGRINAMRIALRSELERLKTPGTWQHITSQIGMFSFTGLNAKQSAAMANKHHIYMLSNGRISMAGINEKNVVYVAKAMDDVIRTV